MIYFLCLSATWSFLFNSVLVICHNAKCSSNLFFQLLFYFFCYFMFSLKNNLSISLLMYFQIVSNISLLYTMLTLNIIAHLLWHICKSFSKPLPHRGSPSCVFILTATMYCHCSPNCFTNLQSHQRGMIVLMSPYPPQHWVSWTVIFAYPTMGKQCLTVLI